MTKPAGLTLSVGQWSTLSFRLWWTYRGPPHPAGVHWEGTEQVAVAWFLDAGSVVLSGPSKPVRARAGEWMICAAGGWRKQDFSADARILPVGFMAHWPSGRPLFEHTPLVVPDARAPALLRSAAAMQRAVARAFPDASIRLFEQPATLAAHLTVDRLFHRWIEAYCDVVSALGATVTEARGLHPRVVAAIQVIERNPPSWTLPEGRLATMTGTSVTHLNRLFVRDLGTTPRAFIDDRRLAAARRRLAVDAVPVKQVAFELGFSSVPHFSRWFKQRAGASPIEYRRQNPPGSHDRPIPGGPPAATTTR